MDKKEFVQDFIPNLDSPDKVYQLFKDLGYQEVGALSNVPLLLDPPYKRKKAEFEFAKEEREKIKNIYTVFNWDGKLQTGI